MHDGCSATAFAVLRLTSVALVGESGDSHYYLQGTCAGRSMPERWGSYRRFFGSSAWEEAKVSKSPKKKPGRNKAPKEQLVINVPEGGAILEITIKVPGGATLELAAGYAPGTTDKSTDRKPAPSL